MGFGDPLSGAVERELDIDRLVYLSRQRFATSIAHMVNGGLAAILLWPDHGIELLAWVAALYGFALFGLAGWFKYRRHPRPTRPPPRLLPKATLQAGLIGLLWGAFCATYMPVDDPVVLLLLCFIITGNAAGGLLVTYPLPAAALAYLAGLMAPPMAALLTIGGMIPHLIFAMGLGYIFFLVLAVRSAYLSFVQQVGNRVEVEALRTEAEKLSRAKTAFLMAVSHELRTPLNAIIGFSEVLRHDLEAGDGKADHIDYTRQIDQSSQVLLRVIDEILDLTRIEAGNVTLVEVPVDLSRAIDRAFAGVKATSLRKRQDVSLPGREAIGVVVRGDQHRLHQILSHLLVNAVKFTPEGGRIAVEIHRPDADEKQGRVEVAIHDTGPGIEHAAQEDIFDPFVQTGSGGSVGQAVGMGLGLPLSLQLARLHGGDVRLESAPGRGTTAIFSLPAARLMPSC